jgi:hypothetical protein
LSILCKLDYFVYHIVVAIILCQSFLSIWYQSKDIRSMCVE